MAVSIFTKILSILSKTTIVDGIRRAPIVRLSRISDWPWLMRIIPEVFPEIEPTQLRHILCNMRPLLVVAEDHPGARVGFCQLDRPSDSNMLWVNFIWIDASSRRRGVGKLMLDWTLSYASRLGCSRVELDVWASNAGAIRFYEGLGYLPVHSNGDNLQREKFRYSREVEPEVPPSIRGALMPTKPARIVLRLMYWAMSIFRSLSVQKPESSKALP